MESTCLDSAIPEVGKKILAKSKATAKADQEEELWLDMIEKTGYDPNTDFKYRRTSAVLIFYFFGYFYFYSNVM